MARSRTIPLVCCLLATLYCQSAVAAMSGAVVAQTGLGLALPGRIPAEPMQAPLDALTEEEYIIERQEQEEEDAINAALLMDTPEGPYAPGLPIPLQLTAAQPVMALASDLSREIRNAVEQAQAIAAQLMKSQGPMKLFNGIGSSAQQQPVNVIELPSLGSVAGPDGLEIDVTVTTERTGPTWMLPSIFPSFFSRSSSKQSDALAAEITQTVIETALANQDKLAEGQELILDMTVENAQPQTTEQLVAAAAAAAASAAAAAANGQQPWDTLELQMEVVETIRPFIKSGRFAIAALLLLAVQLSLCFAVVMLWSGDDDEEEDSDDEEQEQDAEKVVDLKLLKAQQQERLEQQERQGDWAIMAEEGRGVYEKLLSYT